MNTIQIVDFFLIGLAIYLFLGFVFAVFFVLKGAAKLDAGVRAAPWHFKLIIFPGSMLLWIVLLIKLQKRKND